MATRTLNYVAKFSGDTSALKTTLADLNTQLNNISGTRITIDDGSLQDAVKSAQELQKYLASAMNPQTGTLDLTKFNAALKEGGTNITDLSVRLLGMGNQGTSAFTTLATAISQAQTPIRKTNQLLDEMWISMKNTMKWQISSTALHGFMGALSSSIGFAKALDASLNSIRIVTGKSTEDMAAFALEANEAAKALSTTTVDYADASLIYYQQGDSDELVKAKTDITVSAANSAGIEAAEMSDYLTAIWNSYQVGEANLEKFVDVIAKLGAETASSLAEISTGMQKVAATGNAVGVEYEQLASILATVSSVTREAPETIGTAYKTIFARIGDLKLGQTDEDGETLGSVSTNLQKIGVDILDAQGNLKEMGGVVEEIGYKWQGMSDATQVAVAQAIAGKRQYTQLIALFDNWDMYNANLTMAFDSEGALDEMQSTFEEDWEAARNRMKTSFEGMIQGAVQDIDFAGWVDGLSVVVDSIANVTDSLGGMKNIAVVLGTFFATKFSAQIGDTFNDIKDNVKLSLGITSREISEIQSSSQYILEMQRRDTSSSAEGQSLTAANLLLQAKQELALVSQSLSTAEQEQAELQLNNLEQAVNRTHELAQATQEADAQVRLAQKTFMQSAGTGSQYKKAKTGAERKKINTSVDIGMEGLTALVNSSETLQQLKVDSNDTAEALGRVASQLNGMDEASEEASQRLSQYGASLQNYSDAVLKEVDSSLSALEHTMSSMEDIESVDYRDAEKIYASLEALKKDIKDTKLTTELDLDEVSINATTDKVMDFARDAQDLLNQAVPVVETDIVLNRVGTTDLEGIQSVTAALRKQHQAANDTTDSLNGVQDSLRNFQEEATHTYTVAEGLGAAATAAATLYGAMLSLNAIVDVVMDADASGWEKASTTMLTLTMLIPQTIALFQALKTVTGMCATTTWGQSAASSAAAVAEYARAKATAVSTGATAAATKALWAFTAALFSNPITAIASAIAIAATAIIGFAVSANKAAKETEELERALTSLQETSKASQDEMAANQELIVSMRDLLNTYQETGEGKDALDAATAKLCEAYGIEGGAVAKLTGDYEDYADILDRVSDGKYQIELNKAREDTQKYLNLSKKTDDGESVYSKTKFENANSAKVDDVLKAFQGTLEAESKPIGTQFHLSFDEETMYSDISALYERAQEIVANPDFELPMTVNIAQDILAEYSEQIDEIKSKAEDEHFLISTDVTLTAELTNATTLTEYQLAVDNIKTKLSEMGWTAEESANILATMGKNSLNPLIAEFTLLENVVADTSRQSRMNIEELYEIFNSDDYEMGDLVALDWDSIHTTEQFEKAYESAAKYKDILSETATTSELLEQTTAVRSGGANTANMSNLGEVHELRDGFSWGNAQEGIISFIDFFNMATATQQQYLLDLDAQLRDKTMENLQSRTIMYEEEVASLQEKLSTVVDDNGGVQAAYDEIASRQEATQARLSEVIAEIQSQYAALEDPTDIDAKMEILTQFQPDLDELRGEVYKLTDEDHVIELAAELTEGWDKELEDTLDKQSKNLDDITIQAEINFNTDMDNLTAQFKDLETITSSLVNETLRVGDAYHLTAEQAAQWKSIYPDILATATVTTDGMLALNATYVQDYLNGKQTELNTYLGNVQTETQTEIQRLEAYRANLVTQLASYTSNASSIEQVSEALSGEQIGDFIQVGTAMDETSAEGSTLMGKHVAQGVQNSGHSLQQLITMAVAAQKAIAAIGTEEGMTGDALGTVQAAIGNLNIGATVNASGTVSFDGQDTGEGVQSLIDSVMTSALNQEISAVDERISHYKLVLANLATAKKAAFSPASTGGGSGSGGGGSAGTEEELEQITEELIEIASRYHEINKLIEYQEWLLSEVRKELDQSSGTDTLKALDAEAERLKDLAKLYQEKFDAAEVFKEIDKDTLLQLDSTIVIEEDSGNIANYSEALQRQVTIYNEVISKYDGIDLTDEEKAAAEEEINMAKEVLDAWQAAADAYEESVDLNREAWSAIIDNATEQFSNQIAQVSTRVDLKIEVTDNSLEMLDYYITKIENNSYSMANQLGHLTKKAVDYAKQSEAYTQGIQDLVALSEAGEKLTADQKAELERMKDALLETNLAYIELNQTIKDSFLDALSECTDELDDSLSLFDSYTDTLTHYQEILELSGIANKDFALNLTMANGQVDVALNKITGAREKYEMLLATQNDAEAALADATIAGDDESIAYWEETLTNIKGQALDAFNEMNSAWVDALQAAADRFELTIEQVVATLEDALSPLKDLDQFQNAFDQAETISGHYLSTAEQIYELNKLNRDLDKSIDNTSDVEAQKKLLALKQEINEIEESGKQMSDYDLEYLKAKYELLLAETALEESAGSATTLRLIRDSNGNFQHAYTADQFDTSDAAQDYEDQLRRLEELSEKYIYDLSNEIIQNEKDMVGALAAIRREDYDTAEEYLEALNATKAYYYERDAYLRDEMQKALTNLGITYEDTTFGQIENLGDLENAHENLVDNTDSAILDMVDAWTEWRDTVEEAADKAGEEFDNLDESFSDMAGNMSQESENLATQMGNDADRMNEYMNSIMAQVVAWQNQWHSSIQAMIADNEALIASINGMQAAQNGDHTVGFDVATDYTALINSYLANGGQYGDAAYKDLEAQLLNKVAYWKETGQNEQYWHIDKAHLDKLFSNSTGGASRYDEDELWRKILGELSIAGFDTGGYTGSWDGTGKLAVLHEKELVLNQEDTDNVLEAVQIVSGMSDTIGAQLMQNATASLSYLASTMSAPAITPTSSVIEQQVSIEATFPGVQEAAEITEALNNLVNQAAQQSQSKNRE